MEPHPTVLARATFTWAAPGGPGAEFVVTLYSHDDPPSKTVSIDGPAPYVGLVSGSLEWIERHQAIKSDGGYWTPRATFALDDDPKQHLLLKATNALRRVLGLPPHPMTEAWPGTE